VHVSATTHDADVFCDVSSDARRSATDAGTKLVLIANMGRNRADGAVWYHAELVSAGSALDIVPRFVSASAHAADKMVTKAGDTSDRRNSSQSNPAFSQCATRRRTPCVE
jgi:hypothetical protein